jgi:SagB-type dehydrogenase family enzyme
VEAYVAAEDGLYSFDALGRALVRLAEGDARPAVGTVLAVEPEVGAFVVLTGIHARTGWKYMERGYRHVWWDAGTMLANLLALAAAADLAPRLYTAFPDRDLNGLLGIDGRTEYALAVLSLGAPR